jgi:hypothetical protein
MTSSNETAKLALQIAKMAQDPDVPFHEKLEAMKVLTGFYSANNKAKGRDESEGPTFSKFQDRLKEIEKDVN